MRSIVSIFITAIFAVGCATSRAPSSTYGVSSDGTVSAQTRSALNGSTAPGPQEILGIYLPFPPFAIKAGVEYDGNPLIITPNRAQAVPRSASPCTVEQTYMETETYVEMQPVQKTRQVQRTRSVPAVSLPVPHADTQCPCPPEPVAIAK